MHLKGAQLPVRASHGSRGNIVAGLDVGEAALLHTGNGKVRRQGDGDLLPSLGFDRRVCPSSFATVPRMRVGVPSGAWARAGIVARARNAPIRDGRIGILRDEPLGAGLFGTPHHRCTGFSVNGAKGVA